MQPGQPSLVRYPLLAAGLQLFAWFVIVGVYTWVYVLNPTAVFVTEIPLTFALLLISAVGGGGLTAVGIYRLLAYSSRRGAAFFVLMTLSVLSLLWAGTCLYALLIFLTAL
jgi:hypothetical protein